MGDKLPEELQEKERVLLNILKSKARAMSLLIELKSSVPCMVDARIAADAIAKEFVAYSQNTEKALELYKIQEGKGEG